MRQQDIRNEFSNLIENISKDVLKSTVNESIKKASIVIEDKVPEIDLLTKELRSTSDDLIKQSIELNVIKEELNKVTKGGAISSKVTSLENTVLDLKDKVEKNIVESDQNITAIQKELKVIQTDCNAITESGIIAQKKLEDNLVEMLSKQQMEFIAVVEKKSTMIFLLMAGLGLLLLIFN